jgi:citrate lyase subunit beta/citryl-CoA lyase
VTELRGPALLFCPGDRPDRYGKAAERADSVILDLEDAVAPSEKSRAREHLLASRLDPARTLVRVNPVGTPDHRLDLEALAGTAYRTVMLAKTETPEQVAALSGYAVVGLVETARGVLAVDRIAAAPGLVGLMWGAEDLVASLGGTSSRRPDGGYRDVARHARARVLLAAGAFGLAAIDAISADTTDLEGLGREVADAVASGFSATACIHPAQVPVIRAGYAPTPDQLAWAHRVLAAVETGGDGAIAVDGQMVDAPLVRQARFLLSRA